ncbi:hypothetical protein GGI04_003852 [Coemansia thaxteri]|nr:hypothetical protein GGI04_003852 [Coemansia thaxteri]
MKPVITSKSTWPKNSYHHWTHFEQSLSMKKADGSIVVSLLDPEIGLQDRHSTRPSRSITQAPFAYPAMDDLLLPDINAFLEECDCSPQPPPTKDSPSRPGETGDTLHNSILQLDLLTLISYMLTKSGYPVSDNFGSDLNRSLDAALEVAARLPTSASAVFSASGPRT